MLKLYFMKELGSSEIDSWAKKLRVRLTNYSPSERPGCLSMRNLFLEMRITCQQLAQARVCQASLS